MPEPKLTKKSLKVLADLAGLQLSEERLELLLPQMQTAMEARAKLRSLDLEGIEPDVVFSPERE